MAAAATDTQRVPPNQSLYVQNLSEKLQKEDLRRALYMLFSTYGPILDVTALKTPKMRGQAHVLFRDVQSATQAMRSCQGFEFFGREMVSGYDMVLKNHDVLTFDTTEYKLLQESLQHSRQAHRNVQSTYLDCNICRPTEADHPGPRQLPSSSRCCNHAERTPTSTG